ncbi:MAG: Hsp20/alpha crystallin family protein [Oscillospiraceae bacterium]|jgi:HSP20 family protein|nr:Hsp20/alpha crystallin family protein [Oscillospiraceae bacterium]
MYYLTPYRRRSDSLMNSFFRDFDEIQRSFFANESSFCTDIEDDGKNLILSADLPGVEKSDIQIDVSDKRLVISAKRHSNHEDKDKKGNYLRCERSYGSYMRSFSLDGIDAENIRASYENGTLKLTLPKQAEQKPDTRRLEIQ